MDQLLLLSLLLPLLGAAVVWAVAPQGRAAVRGVALAASLAALAAAGWLTFDFVAGNPPPDIDLAWLAPEGSGIDVRFSLGLDGLSLWLYALTALLMVSAVLVSWEAIDEGAATYYGLLLLLETGMLGVFTARDVILFYICFEFTLIPLFFLIGIWGHHERRWAAIKFFVYTLAGSVITFLGLLAMVWAVSAQTGRMTFSIPELTAALQEQPLDPAVQWWIALALLAGFAIKVPLFPLHTWLPLAHVEAPTAGSVLLAGVLLKIGTYGFVRFSLPMLPDAAAAMMPWILWLAVAGILYGALVALAQADIKRLIAYSSVSHLGYCMLGMFALNRLGLQGSVLQMVHHGLATGALFALVGMIYERYHTREIRKLGGLARRLPWLAFFFVFFTLASIGLPGLGGFAGEMLLLLGAFQRGFAEADPALAWQLRTIAVLAVFGVVLGAWYMLWLVQRILFGPLREPAEAGHEIRDLSAREIGLLAPLAVFVLWIGLWPQFFLRPMQPTLTAIADRTAAAAAARSGEVHVSSAQEPSEKGELIRVE